MAIGSTVRPSPEEYGEHYQTYVELVPETDVVAAMERQVPETVRLLSGIPATLADYRYDAGKWTVREVIGHIIDTERIFGFRALAFARGEKAPVPGADENEYVRHAAFDRYRIDDLGREYEHLRRAHVSFFGHLAPEAWGRSGTANELPVTVRALAFIILGHERHHLKIMREQYIPGNA